MDRIGRNTKDILDVVQDIKERGCLIKFHKENLVFDGSQNDLYGDLMLTILSAFSQFERNIMLERQREGIEIARQKGRYKGRKKKLSDEQLLDLRRDFENNIPKTEISKKYGVTRSYVYQLAKGT